MLITILIIATIAIRVPARPLRGPDISFLFVLSLSLFRYYYYYYITIIIIIISIIVIMTTITSITTVTTITIRVPARPLRGADLVRRVAAGGPRREHETK